jgi:hypothetical protein
MTNLKPDLALSKILEIIDANKVPRDKYPVVVVAIRGYRLDDGNKGINDRRIYDDAHFIVWPKGVARFYGNTDPNGYRKGQGMGSGRGMASLCCGIHFYGTGLHKGRAGFRQAEPFTVLRDGNPPYRDLGWHAINWHDGGETSTSSLGCQTNKFSVFRELQPLLYGLLYEFGNVKSKTDQLENVPVFPYILIEEVNRRNGNLVVSRRFF